MNDSQHMAVAFHHLRRLCQDIALLLKTSDEIFKRHGWSTQSGSGCLYAGSASLDWPDYWLPRQFYRSYCNLSHDRFLVYVAVVIDLPKGREQEEGIVLITAGGLKYAEADPSRSVPRREETNLYRWHLLRADLESCNGPSWHAKPFAWNPHRLWKGWEKSHSMFESAVTMAMPLHEVSNSADLESRIIEPLLREITENDAPQQVSSIIATQDILNDVPDVDVNGDFNNDAPFIET
ncbi:hypothetical protein [Planctomicrobium sp. SH527]|uniref:hypothetical protein n=1 Tax=Planctomicrobium sp. SH527 TaxID=3448123 RepID=UPI003F5B2B22